MVPQRLFEVSGRLIDRSGEPARNVLPSVLDADPCSDDLVGAGIPDEDGARPRDDMQRGEP